MGKRILVAIAFTSLWLAAPAVAQTESKCLSSQLKASGAYAEALAKCESKAAAKGEAVDAVCVAKAAEKVATAFAKAEGKDDCVVTGTPVADAVDGRVVELVEDITKILNPPPAVCCALGVICTYAADAAECTGTFSGTPGAEGSVCTGSGACAAPPAIAGSCCQDVSTGGMSFDCINGGFSAGDCAGVGGTVSTAVCSPSGLCL